MARIYQRVGKKGPLWYLDYIVDGRRVRKKCGHHKRLADLALADVRVKLERKELGFQVKDRPVEDFIQEYLQYAKNNKSRASYERNEIVLRTFQEFLQVDRLRAISPAMIEAYKGHRLKGGTKPSTINTELNTIKAMLNKAVAWGHLAKNPAHGIKRLKEARRKVRFLSPEEIRGLLEASGARMRLIIAAMLYTGLRRNELIHLAWEDMDFDKKILSVQAKEGWHPKDYEVRRIPLNDRILGLLKAHGEGGSGGSYVFPSRQGGPLLGNTLSRDFRKLARSCGIKGVSIHTLRHTFASYLVMGGVDLYTVQKLLGHSSIKTTEIYAHLAPDYLRSAITKLDFKLTSKPGSKIPSLVQIRPPTRAIPPRISPAG